MSAFLATFFILFLMHFPLCSRLYLARSCWLRMLPFIVLNQ